VKLQGPKLAYLIYGFGAQLQGQHKKALTVVAHIEAHPCDWDLGFSQSIYDPCHLHARLKGAIGKLYSIA